MSIIEKMLAKGQTEQSRAGNAVPEGRALQRGPGSRGAGSSAHPASQHHTPRESFALDFEKLRAEGMMPSEELADATQHQFRRIKWPLLEYAASNSASDPRTTPANLILVTSSIPNEGKTFTSLNLAFSIARERDYSVLLIDADSAKRHITKLLGLAERRGLSDLIDDDGNLDPEDAVLGTGVPGLTVLPAGGRSDSAPELFASERMSRVAAQLGANDSRRILLFDAAPLLVTSEPQVLSRIVDQIVLVVRAEFTTQPTVLDAMKLLDPTKQVRCVLNLAPLSNWAEYYYGDSARPRAGTREHGRVEG
jgi:exopolysaccharide/PEP-CTERM locus tyrosine autokinase